MISDLNRERYSSGRRLFAVALFCAALSPSGFSQSVYKWKDGAGTVHYSEQAPAAGVKSTQMKLSRNDVQPVLEPAQIEVASSDTSALSKANDDQEKHLCSVARQNQKMLGSSAIIASGGDIATAGQLDVEQRDRARNEATSQIAQYCHDQ